MKAGWVTKCLGDFAAVSTGPFGSIFHKSDYVDDGVPLVNPINIVGDNIVPDTSKLISGETIKRLSSYVLDEGDVVVGRRGEIQRRIVAILDETFDGIGTAKANTEKNRQNSRALFESHLQSVFTKRGESWWKQPLGDVCDLLNGFVPAISTRS